MSELKSQVYYDELLREMDLRYSWGDPGRVVESNPVVEVEPKPKQKPAAPEHGSNARYAAGCRCSFCKQAHAAHGREYRGRA